jgi:hypothetical protein
LILLIMRPALTQSLLIGIKVINISSLEKST